MHHNYRVYLDALNRVDKQFEALLNTLEETGALDNSLVVLVSDHGESFMLEKDLLLSASGNNSDNAHVQVLPGHGTSVLDEAQYNVTLAFRRYGGKAFQATHYSEPVSLIDVAPTLEHYLWGSNSEFYDGVPLDSVLVGDVPPPGGRYFFRESGFSVPAILTLRPDMDSVFHQGSEYYEIDKSNGRLELRESLLGELISTKQRAVSHNNWVLAAIPGFEGAAELVLLDKQSKRYWLEDEFETASAPVEPLLEQLCHHYAGEIETLLTQCSR